MLVGCSTFSTGTSQSISVATVPPGAVCNLTRDNLLIALVPQTPGTATVTKSKLDIAVDCVGGNGLRGAGVIPAGEQVAASLGNVLAGFYWLGYGVDLATGAANEYPRGIRIWLDGPGVPAGKALTTATYYQHPKSGGPIAAGIAPTSP